MCHSPGSVSHSTEIIGVWHHARLKYLICKASSRTCWRRTLGSRNILTLLFPIPAGCRVLIPYSCNYLGTLPYKALVRVQAPMGPKGACRLETCKTCFPPPTPPWLTASAPSLKLSGLLTHATEQAPEESQILTRIYLLELCPTRILFIWTLTESGEQWVCNVGITTPAHPPTSPFQLPGTSMHRGAFHCEPQQTKKQTRQKEIKNWGARQLQVLV